MKLTFTITLLYLMNILSVFGQSENPELLLSNYTYSSQQNKIGEIYLQNAGTSSPGFTLKGENAKVFVIRHKSTLFIRPQYNKPDVKWYDVVIEAGAVSDTFRIVNDRFHRNGVIAHRGAWKNTQSPENSIAALKHAIAMGCQGSEFDVHMSADDVPFVNHDPAFKGVFLEKSSSSELASLKLSNGESLPTLESYLLAGVAQNNTRLILEIKPSIIGKEKALLTARRVVEMVKRLKAQAWIDYISFDYDICKEVLRLDPFARVAYLNGDKSPRELAQDKMWGLDYHFNVLKKNEQWLAQAREHRLTTNVWTVNDPALMDWFLQQKADFITTNEPELLLEKVSNK